jgi:hypothetical protein
MDIKIVYQASASDLDSFPKGYPSKVSGAALQLLAALFTPNEER